jgi:hypothetical protein
MQWSTHTRRLAGVCVLCCLLIGCATPRQTRQLLDRTDAALPLVHELQGTPFYSQERYQCGPAALAAVLTTHAVSVTPTELVDAVFTPALHGSLPEEMAATARRYGMLAYPLQASLADLLEEIARGNPVVVLQNLGTRWLPKWHFAVAIGYDLPAADVILRSGTTRRLRTSLATFERTWSRGGHWALVILPAGDIPATALPDRYLQAAHDLEQSGRATAALAAYQAAARHWPDDARSWLAIGNLSYHAGDYPAATRAFRQGVSLAPADPQGWNNLAYALLYSGCPLQSRQAAACAVHLAPDGQDYRDTLAEIDARARGSDRSHCVPIVCGATGEAAPAGR